MFFSLYDVNFVRLDDQAHGHVLDDTVVLSVMSLKDWWVEEDLNLRPHAYQACALTT